MRAHTNPALSVVGGRLCARQQDMSDPAMARVGFSGGVTLATQIRGPKECCWTSREA